MKANMPITQPTTLVEQARELARMSPYSSQYVRESRLVIEALADEVLRLRAAAEKLSDYAQHGPRYEPDQEAPACTSGLEDVINALLTPARAIVIQS